jgi:predicted glycosyltransferase involved in capsule biosynthesis
VKTDLNNIGLMIHFRRDVDDRFRNLEMVVKFYRENSENLQIAILNDDKQLDKDFKRLCKQYDCKGLFMVNHDVYWRTKAFNEMSKILDVDYLIAGDTDVIVDPVFLHEAKYKFEKYGKGRIIYPYNGMFIHLKQPMFEKFVENQSLVDLLEKSQSLKPIPYDQDDNFLVAHPHSKGGMVMFSKETFIRCNGYNPNFKGWGYEDDEILARFNKMGCFIDRVEDKNAIAWHLPHENTVREKHPYYDNNRRHSDFVCGNTKREELEQYTKSWTL